MIKIIKKYPLTSYILYRILNSFLLRTIFEPDEIWQNIEPIPYLFFNEGVLTWDWKTGIRTINAILPYLIPHFIFFKFFPTQYPKCGFYLTKVVSGILSGICDYFVYKLGMSLKINADNLIFSTLFSHGLWLYAARSHINSLEMTSIAVITYYLTKYNRNVYRNGSRLYLLIATIGIAYISYCRPTSVFFIGVLCLENPLCLFLIVPLTVLIYSMLISIDCKIYGEFIIPPWNFAKLNLFYGMSDLFGKQPWYCYFIFITILCGILPILIIYNDIRLFFRRNKNKKDKVKFGPKSSGIRKPEKRITYVDKTSEVERTRINWVKMAMLVYFTAYMFIGHKEMRFLVPLIPFINMYSSKHLTPFLKRVLAISLFVSFFIGLTHQNYINTLDFLHKKIQEQKLVHQELRNKSKSKIFSRKKEDNSEKLEDKKIRVLYCVCPYSLPAQSYFFDKNVIIDHIFAEPDIFSKKKDIKFYKKFGTNILVNEFGKFIDKGFLDYEFDKYDFILCYDWIYDRIKNRLDMFKNIRAEKYCNLCLEAEKGKIIYILKKKNI
ncbi:hypothetical protein EDEG_03133 [Edhazardia aedis USNM 41457]|uniref:Mannosyltransferase n=1 Tax=Edhazardia aedis (strain USNM 41457) TaxID=1003232 RepID=J9DIM1_EDHAE|nr:hypothetical protein EDEG_03133 [Edhazardia aedis USNM 41457]|eukprot:EJW02460.1 hypothetical protein EDEG_03133 [Edhazardia aedis USNM 41457]